MKRSLLQTSAALWMALSLLHITACSPTAIKPSLANLPDNAAALKAGTALLGHAVTEAELPKSDLYGLTPELKTFAERATATATSPLDKALALHKALITPQSQGGRGFQFSADTTELPAVTFARRQANCLSFSLLYVALARHLQLEAFINQVDIPPNWSMSGDTSMFFVVHINAMVKFPSESRGLGAVDYVVVDLALNKYRPSYPQRALSPELIEAQFYSNRGTEALANNQFELAFLNLRKAIAADSQQSYVWNNLAIVYKRAGLLAEAEQAYLKGLSYNHTDLTIMNNLAFLYEELNAPEKARYFSAQVKEYRNSNPYFEYSQALTKFGEGDASSALTHIQRAIAKESDVSRFYQLASTIHKTLNEPRNAQLMQQKYEKLAARGL
ncbi:MAG TPA: hypothetical protein VIZ65_02125 [Cellvibrionaceae bacterium]